MKVNSLSRVRLLATPWTAAHQAPPSMEFSRQEYWSGMPLPSPLLNTVTSFLTLTCRQINLFLWSVFCQLNSRAPAEEPKRREEKSFLSNSCSL